MSFEKRDGILDWFLGNWHRLLITIVLLLFLAMVGCLLGFHIYLASINLTTWEFMSWNKISYLKNLNKEKGSPFSHGYAKNLYVNCCKRVPKYLIPWKIQPELRTNI